MRTSGPQISKYVFPTLSVFGSSPYSLNGLGRGNFYVYFGAVPRPQLRRCFINPLLLVRYRQCMRIKPVSDATLILRLGKRNRKLVCTNEGNLHGNLVFIGQGFPLRGCLLPPRERRFGTFIITSRTVDGESYEISC